MVPPIGFLDNLKRICAENEVLFIADEIFTGFGRSGHWLACDREGVVPDIICVGKSMTGGVASSACIADHGIMNALTHTGLVPLHGSTFAANALACVSITATINVLKRDDLIIQYQDNLGKCC